MLETITIVVSIGLFGGGYAPYSTQPATIDAQPAANEAKPATSVTLADEAPICLHDGECPPPPSESKGDVCICLPPVQGKDGRWYEQLTGEEVPPPPYAE